jgi:hypothetical protein
VEHRPSLEHAYLPYVESPSPALDNKLPSVAESWPKVAAAGGEHLRRVGEAEREK